MGSLEPGHLGAIPQAGRGMGSGVANQGCRAIGLRFCRGVEWSG